MARPKKVVDVPEVAPIEVVPTKIEHLSVDYPNEGLNNIARKINEIIDLLNGTQN